MPETSLVETPTVEAWGITCRACKGPTLIHLGPRPESGRLFERDRWRHLDGSLIVPSDPTTCESCGHDWRRTGMERPEKWRRYYGELPALGDVACPNGCGMRWPNPDWLPVHQCWAQAEEELAHLAPEQVVMLSACVSRWGTRPLLEVAQAITQVQGRRP